MRFLAIANCQNLTVELSEPANRTVSFALTIDTSSVKL